MKVIRYHVYQNFCNGPSEWLEAWYNQQMEYMASDLLVEGLQPVEIARALSRAMAACRSAGQEVDQHFSPVYTPIAGSVFEDCRLSKTGLALTLMNANPLNSAVAAFQMQLLRKYFSQ